MKSTCFLSITFIFSIFTTFGQGDKWDLRRCVEYGMKFNINVRQAEIQADQAKIDYNQNSLSLFPSLGYGLTHGFSFGRTLDRTTNVYTSRSAMFQQMNLQSNVLLFNFNSRKNNMESSKLNMEAQQVAVDKIRNDIGLNIAQLYLRALLSYEQVRISEVVLMQTKAQYNNTRKLVDAGSLPELNAAELAATPQKNWLTTTGAIMM